MAKKTPFDLLATGALVIAVLAVCNPLVAPGPTVKRTDVAYPRGCSEGEVRSLVAAFITGFNDANQALLEEVLSPVLDVYAVSGAGNANIVIRGRERTLQELARSRSAGELVQLRDLRVIPFGMQNLFVGLEFNLEKRIRGQPLAFTGKGTVDCNTHPPRILAWDMAAPDPRPREPR